MGGGIHDHDNNHHDDHDKYYYYNDGSANDDDNDNDNGIGALIGARQVAAHGAPHALSENASNRFEIG